MLFKIANLNSNLALILGYLNPALNNSALLLNQPNIKKGGRRKQKGSLSKDDGDGNEDGKSVIDLDK